MSTIEVYIYCICFVMPQDERFLEEMARLDSLLQGRREALEEWRKEQLKKKQVSRTELVVGWCPFCRLLSFSTNIYVQWNLYKVVTLGSIFVGCNY